MSNDQEISFNLIQSILFQLQEPVVFKNILSVDKGISGWKLLDWSLDEFAEKSGNQKLPFRVGKNIRTLHPQWEAETSIEHKTMKEFLKEIKTDDIPSKWFYFDYKHINKWFEEKPDILSSFDWQQFGSELNATDSTIWVGSKGAHTNCHQDAYSCNLVAQVHGRKLWLLFSPDVSSSMQSTRIPYEESTIYSEYNFFAPGKKEIEAIKNMPGSVKMIILEPKDVLFIPNGWWHYVESLETSMSVNVWMPLEEDCYSRLRESLVHLIINTVGDGVSKSVDQPDSNSLECIQLIEKSIMECQQFENSRKSIHNEKVPMKYLHTILKERFNATLVSNLTTENIDEFINKNTIAKDETIGKDQNISEISESKQELSTLRILEAVVDAFCDPEITLRISQILTDKLINKKS